MRATSAFIPSKKASLSGRLPATTIRVLLRALFSSLSPSKEKTSLRRSGPYPRRGHRRRPAPPSSASRVQRVDDARQRIQQRGRLVGEVRRDSPEAVRHDALRNEQKIREGAEERPLERGRAEVSRPARQSSQLPQGPDTAEVTRSPGEKGVPGPVSSTTPANSCPSVSGNGNFGWPRFASLKSVAHVSATRMRTRTSPGRRTRRRDVAEREPLRPLRDESPHGRRA